MRYRQIHLRAGVRRAIHVYTPELLKRLSGEGYGPVVAIRSELDDFNSYVLCRGVEWSGRTSLVELFDKPLPGTGGRGVVYNLTASALTVLLDQGQPFRVIRSLEADLGTVKDHTPKVERTIGPLQRAYTRRSLVSVG